MNDWGLPNGIIRPLTVYSGDVRSVVYPNLAFDSVSGAIAQSLSSTDRRLFSLRFQRSRPGRVSLWVSEEACLWSVTPHTDGVADELVIYLKVLEHEVRCNRCDPDTQALRVFTRGVFELIDCNAPRLDRTRIRRPPGAWILMPEGQEDA